MTSQIIQLFNVAEKDGSATATITMDQICKTIEDPATLKEWKAIGVQAEDAKYLFRLLDLDGCGDVAFDEFLGGCLRLSGAAKAVDVLTVMQETRKNEDKFLRKFCAIEDSLIDIHETVRTDHDEISRTMGDISFLIETVTENQQEFRHMMFSLGRAFQEIKASLGPLELLEAVLTEVPSSETLT